MSYLGVKRDQKIRAFLAVATDFIRYTFTPAVSVVLLICAFGAFATMAVLFYRFQPIVAVTIFCGYAGFFLLAMVASFKKWKRYRAHYENVFRK